MAKIKFKCRICGKSFEKLSSMSRHVIMSKDHPSIAEYYEKYPESDDKLKKYHKEYKKAKKEKDDKLLGDDKKTFVVRGDTPLVHVADMGLSNTHSLVAINSKECNLDFLRLLPTIFSRTNIHLCIMGAKSSNFQDKIPEGLTTSLLIDSVAFNYSLAINILLKPIYEKFPMAKISICDGWTIFSSIQVIKKEMNNLDWDNEFIRIDTVFDIADDPINLKMDSMRLSSSVLNRLRNMKDLNYHIPIIICRAKYLVDLESGLEEDLFTEFSRSHLRNQLVTAGLTEKVCTENKGLFIRPRTSNNQAEDIDINLIKKIAPRMNNFIFIPSNYEIDFGNINRIKHLVIEKRVPKWDYVKYKKPLTKIYDLDKSKQETFTDQDENVKSTPLTSEVVLTDFSKLLSKKHKVLLMVNSKIRDLLTTTPLIRGLYEKFGVVDILTKDKLDPINTIIQNYMVKKIYDLQDVKNKFFSLKQYGPNVIRTIGCKINELNKKVKILEPVNVYDDIIETNYSMVDPYVKDMPKPYCNFETSKAQQNMLVVAISIDKSFDIDAKIWRCLETIGSRIGNNKGVNVCLLSLAGERKLFLTDKFKIRKNFHIFDNITPFKASGIIKNSSLFLTTSDTQTAWLSWGLDAPTIMLDINSEIPVRENESRFFIESRSSKVDIDAVVNQIWRNL